jgi:putative RNA 2'-phosphotransferase
MDRARLVKVSKYLSRHLRHEPERLGLELEPGGWVRVDDLLAACARRSFALTREELEEVVARNDKRRFSLDATGTRIRANQGHSVGVDLGLAPLDPPELLYHGTARARLDRIMSEGLHRMGRHHVHLSPDAGTAARVGARHGKPVVLEVAAGRMAADGHAFYVTDNGVWLTDTVPPDYLTTS